MDRVRKLIHTNYAYKTGLTGQNINIVVLDTGIAVHRDFGDRIRLFKDFCRGREALYDDHGHGTHVCGIIAGSGMPHYSGIAPGASLFVLKILDGTGNGDTETMRRALQWVIEHDRVYHFHLLNISIGMRPAVSRRAGQELLDAVDEIWSRGIMVVTAAGNNGPGENSVTVPGISRKVLTVGSSDDSAVQNMHDLTSGYSGTGPTGCCIVKPEIYAPGTNIVSCSTNGHGYTTKSGTSMAAPVVTGALALAFQKFPDMTPAQMKLRLYERAYPRAEMFGKRGWGMIHVDHLVRG
jgi:serine protease AprX